MTLSIEDFSDQFFDLFEAFPGVVYRLHSGEEGMVPGWVGRNFSSVTGYRPEMIIGTTFWWKELIHPDDRKQATDALATAVNEGSASVQYRVKHCDGSYRQVRDEIRRDDTASGDAAPCLFGSWSDISFGGTDFADLEETRAALQVANQQAEKATLAKSQFLSVMSHELRTPLNAIIGFSDVILMKAFGPIGSDKYADYIEDIRNSGKRLLVLVNDLLDVSTLESGKLILKSAHIDIAWICHTCIDAVSAEAERGMLQLNCHVDPEIPLLMSDQQRLKQVLINLLSNAIKFTPERGEVLLRAGVGPSGGIQFEISDTGIGMDEQDLEVAFSNFGQVDSSLSRKHEGSGLGLPLAVSLVKALGGELEVKSRPDRGTNVVVQFPKYRSVPAAR